MAISSTNNSDKHVLVVNPAGVSSVVLVCEHASNFIPESFSALGLSKDDQQSHAAWDPGAMAVAKHMSDGLDAVLVSSDVSRLVYDCNRPPSAASAMPARSEVIDVPGNVGLSDEGRADRAARFYWPFHAEVAAAMERTTAPVLVTVHSFTPIYHGEQRAVEIGILHDSDTRLADAMLETAASHVSLDVQRNAPYGASDGVTHTLQEHAIRDGHLNVMLEIRNDLIETPAQQHAMANSISRWIADACARLNVSGIMQCQA